MKFLENKTNGLLDLIEASVDANSQNNQNITDGAKFIDPHLKSNDCTIIVDLMKRDIISCKGIKNLLGFHKCEVTLDFLDKNRHPDDTEIVNKVGVASILYTYDNPSNNLNYLLCVKYRRQKKDGSYIKILSKTSAHEVDDKGRIIKLLIRFTDISFMDQSDIVRWNFEIDNLDVEAFRQNIYKDYRGFYTKREKEVLIEMGKGNNNKEIADKLCISKHTVATHRKNIFKKTDARSLNDLMLFCKKNGII